MIEISFQIQKTYRSVHTVWQYFLTQITYSTFIRAHSYLYCNKICESNSVSPFINSSYLKEFGQKLAYGQTQIVLNQEIGFHISGLCSAKPPTKLLGNKLNSTVICKQLKKYLCSNTSNKHTTDSQKTLTPPFEQQQEKLRI